MVLFGKKVLVETVYKKQIQEVIKMANIIDTTPPQRALGLLDAQKGNIQAMSSLKKYQKNSYLKAIDYAKKFFDPVPTTGTVLKK